MAYEQNESADARYLITKRGAYYRPNAEGYTSDKAAAGRFTLAEAIDHSHPNGPNGPRDGISYALDDSEPAAPTVTETPEGVVVTQEQTWLRDLLLDRIQFYIWSDATAADVQKVIDGLSESDECDAHVAALVRMPKWCGQDEAQKAVDRHFAYTPTLRGEEVERLASDLRGIKGAFERIAEKHPNDQPAYRDGVRPWGTGDLRHCIETLDAAAAALSQPLAVDTGQSVPAGWKLVPIEPTEGMLAAARIYDGDERAAKLSVWSAMLAATPAPSVSPGQQPGALDEAMRGYWVRHVAGEALSKTEWADLTGWMAGKLNWPAPGANASPSVSPDPAGDEARPISDHPCHGLFASAGDRLTHRHWFQDNQLMPTCERCGTLIDKDHKEVGPVSWAPEKRREIVTVSDRYAISRAAMQALGEWLAWPDAGRDGPREVTVEQTLSFLRGLPNKLGYSAALASSPIPKTFPREAVGRVVETALYNSALDGSSAEVRVTAGEITDAIAALLQEDRQS